MVVRSRSRRTGVRGQVLAEGLTLLPVFGEPVADLGLRQRLGQGAEPVLDPGMEALLTFAHVPGTSTCALVA